MTGFLSAIGGGQGLGSILGGLGSAYGAYASYQGMKDMANQQARANQLAREQFAYAKQLDKSAVDAQQAKQNELEQGLAYSLYGQQNQQTQAPGMVPATEQMFGQTNTAPMMTQPIRVV